MKRYDHIIWDFNGTLLDDVQTGICSVNALLRERGLAEIKSKEHYREIFRFPIIEYYRSLGFDFEREPYEVLAPLWVALYLENVKAAGLYPDVIDTLELVKSMEIGQSVLSATELSMLEGQLETLGIRGYFDEVMGLDNIHAGSKLSLAYEWRARHEGERVLLIGDTDHDVETACALGADCMLVSRGHQSRRHLLSVCGNVADDLEEIKALLIER